MSSQWFTEEFKNKPPKHQIIILYREVIKIILNEKIREEESGIEKDLQEIVQALELDLIPRSKGTQGFDALDNEGRKIELKKSDNSLKKRANYNFSLPESIKRNQNNVSECYWIIYHSQLKKSDLILLQHSNRDDETFDSRYIAILLCLIFKKNQTLKINLGGLPCKNCKLVHRIEHFKTQENRILKLFLQIKKLTKESLFEFIESISKEGLLIPVKSNC